jgi:hypothetical protein
VKIDGRCHCGFITYEAEIDPERVEICHCSDCQILSGSTFLVFAQIESELVLLSGEPTIYVKTADSGNKRAQMFCPRCGTHIFTSANGGGPPRYIRVSTARQRDELPPKMQGWFRSAQPWLFDLARLPKK